MKNFKWLSCGKPEPLTGRMIMKRLGLLFGALLLTIGFVVAQSGKGAVISSAAPEFDFGIIKEANGKVSHTFIVKNIGDAPLVITRVATPCACTTPE